MVPRFTAGNPTIAVLVPEAESTTGFGPCRCCKRGGNQGYPSLKDHLCGIAPRKYVLQGIGLTTINGQAVATERSASAIRAVNQQRLIADIHSAASLPHLPDLPQRFACGLARVMLGRSLANARRGVAEAAQSPLSWASERATMCSISVWRVLENCSRYRGRRSCHPWPPRPASRATANSGSPGCYRASSDARERRRGPAIHRRQPTKCLPGMPDVVIAYSRLQIPRQSGRVHLEM